MYRELGDFSHTVDKLNNALASNDTAWLLLAVASYCWDIAFNAPNNVTSPHVMDG